MSAARRQRIIGPREETAADALAATLGVYASPPMFALSTIARSTATATDALAMLGDLRLVRLRAMRGSVYAVPRAAFPTVFAATSAQMRKVRASRLRSARIEPDEAGRLRERTREFLAGGRIASVAQMRDAAGDPSPEAHRHFAILVSGWAADGLLVRAGAPKGWRDPGVAYGLTTDLLPDLELPGEQAACADLARAYLRGFGPVTREDFVWWSGLPTRGAREAFAVAVGGDPGPDELVDGPDPPPLPASGETVRLLPAWDTYLVAYRDRSRQVDPAHLPWVYDASGNAASVVCLDGRAVGLWQLDGADGARVAWLPDAPAPPLDEVETELARLLDRLGTPTSAPRLSVVDLPPPLARQRRNAHLAPLQKTGET